METSNLICVKLYLDEKEFAEVVEEAQKAKIRPLGLKLRVLKNKGGLDIQVPNTKYLAKFFKHTLKAWKDGAATRAVQQAEALRKLKEAEQAARDAGAIA